MSEGATVRFAPGARVKIKAQFPPGHVRTPYFTRGKEGHIAQLLGVFRDPEGLAYGARNAAAVPLYRVRFGMTELWGPGEQEGDSGEPGDGLTADIYETWLEPVA